MTPSNVINEFIETRLSLPWRINNDIIQDVDGQEVEGACLRYDPAPAAEKRYGDGSRLLVWSLTYFIRCQRADKARQYAYDITNVLDGATIEGMDIEAATLPQFITKDDKGFTTYSAGITCTYLEETK